MKLRTKLALLTFAVVTLMAALALTAIGLSAQRGMEMQAEESLQRTQAILNRMIENRRTTLRQASALIVELPIFRSVIQTRDRATIDDALAHYQGQLEASALLVTDEDGGLLGLSGGDGTSFATLVNSPRELQVEIVNGKPYLVVSVPIAINGYGKGTLTVLSEFGPRAIRGIAEDIGDDVLLTLDSVVIASSGSASPKAIVPSAKPYVLELDGRRFLVDWSPLRNVANAHLGLAVMKPEAEMSALTGRLRGSVLALLGMLLPASLLISLILAKSITGPLERVIKGARTLQEGGWPERTPITRSDEVGLLQKVFDETCVSLRETRERLLALANHDALTELLNHRAFQERLENEIEHGSTGALIVLDIQEFAAYNKALGHAQGDEALVLIAECVRKLLPPNAFACRWSGDEIAVFVPGDEQSALDLGERLIASVDGAFATRERRLSTRIGYAVFPQDAQSAESLSISADLGATLAKESSGIRIARGVAPTGGSEHALREFLGAGDMTAIMALAEAVDAKDPYTHGHSRRVAEYASELARHVGMDDQFVELVYRTGILHDVGKIGVPDSVLQKPGRLDDDERPIMERHPELGERIVSWLPHLADTLPGVRHHHERWDGAGYPDKLAGKQIPYTARFLAVADTFDAMTSDRPYRKGLSLELALAEIRKNAGTQFDPELASAFVEMYEFRLRGAA